MPESVAEPMPKPERKKRLNKREMMLRDARIIERLAAGLSVEEMAAREEISPRRARDRVAAMLKREAANHPAEYVALQIRRLSEALIVAYGAMGGRTLRRWTGWSRSCGSSAATISGRASRPRRARRRPRSPKPNSRSRPRR